MHIVIGSGNNRQSFEVATGHEMKILAKTNPVEHTKIVGNLKALVRRQPTKILTNAAFAKLRAKNERQRRDAEKKRNVG